MTEQRKIALVKLGSLKRNKIKELEDAGILVLLVNDIADVKFNDSENLLAGLSTSEVLNCALKSLEAGNDNTCRYYFGKYIREEIQKKIKIDTETLTH